MDEFYSEMWLDEKTQTPCERCVSLGSGAIWSTNLHTTICTSHNKSRMRANLQSARDYRLSDAVPIKARVDTAIQGKDREQ